jgi:hypothetical protein
MMSWNQAMVIALMRAARTGIRQRVQACVCGCGFTVRAADRVPASVMA